jgi:4-amino-4-deoxy-L-arabinose transferase-like glycosyltransferase
VRILQRFRLTPLVAALVLLAAGLALRLHRIDEPVLTFHPTRQYRSALIARSCYYDADPSVPDWLRHVARADRSMQPEGEPPLLEWVACGGYRLLGHETLVLPAVVSVFIWVFGAVGLYLLIRDLISPESGLTAIAVYLFLPYGVIASRSFQPDGLMTACSVWAILAISRYQQDPSRVRLLIAAAAIGVAAVVKPMSVFVTMFALAGLTVGLLGLSRAVRRSDVYAIALLGLLPGALYYGYGAVFGHLAKDQMRERFVPHLLTSAFFWKGLVKQVRRVYGLPVFLAAVIGVPLARRGPVRGLLVGLFAGYAAFALAFTYHVPTHDYYHLPYIVPVSIGIAALGHRLRQWVSHRQGHEIAARMTIAVSLLIGAVGSVAAWPQPRDPSLAATARRYAEIGELTKHDTKVIFLDLVYGYPLMYHGQVSGDSWPNSDDLAAEALDGEPPLDAEARFDRDYADFDPHYFVVTDIASFAAQVDLQRLLEKRARLVRKTPQYVVYEFVGRT